MTHPLAERFAQPVSGPSYRTSARLMVVSTIVSLCAYGARTVIEHDFGWTGWLVLLGAGAMVALTGWSVLAGRTTIDARGIHQGGLPAKELRWDEIVRARRIRLPLTCRLLVSTGRGPLKAMHSGDRALDEAFDEIAGWYQARI
jgi:hypothetical protein